LANSHNKPLYDTRNLNSFFITQQFPQKDNFGETCRTKPIIVAMLSDVLKKFYDAILDSFLCGVLHEGDYTSGLKNSPQFLHFLSMINPVVDQTL